MSNFKFPPTSSEKSRKKLFLMSQGKLKFGFQRRKRRGEMEVYSRGTVDINRECEEPPKTDEALDPEDQG